MSLVATWKPGARPTWALTFAGIVVGWFIVFGLFGNLLMLSPRRFPPPWTVEELNDAGFVIKDSTGQKIAYAYYEDEFAHENDGSP